MGEPFDVKVDEIHEGLDEGLKLRNGGSEMGWYLQSTLGEPFNVKVNEINMGLDECLKLRNGVVAPGYAT